jgi:hypothetical protein
VHTLNVAIRKGTALPENDAKLEVPCMNLGGDSNILRMHLGKLLQAKNRVNFGTEGSTPRKVLQ